jgi:TPR repeat protein
VNSTNRARLGYETGMRSSLLFVILALPALAAEPPPEPTITLADLERACAKGDQVACVDYGYNLEPQAPDKAVAVYRAACAKNTLAACSNLALMLRDARGAAKNLDEAAKVAKKACDGGNAPGCLHLALVKDAANDFPGATAAYERACKVEVLQGCTNFAINLIKGVGVAKDEARGVALLEKSCEGSLKRGAPWPSLRACLVLGQLYEQGGTVTKDKEAAKKLYRLACFSGSQEGCERLGAGPKNVNDHGDGHGH